MQQRNAFTGMVSIVNTLYSITKSCSLCVCYMYVDLPSKYIKIRKCNEQMHIINPLKLCNILHASMLQVCCKMLLNEFKMKSKQRTGSILRDNRLLQVLGTDLQTDQIENIHCRHNVNGFPRRCDAVISLIWRDVNVIDIC